MKLEDMKVGQKVRWGDRKALQQGWDRNTAEVTVVRIGKFTNVWTTCGQEASKVEMTAGPRVAVVQVRGTFGQRQRYNRWAVSTGTNIPLVELAVPARDLMSVEEWGVKRAVVVEQEKVAHEYRQKVAAASKKLEAVAREELAVPPGAEVKLHRDHYMERAHKSRLPVVEALVIMPAKETNKVLNKSKAWKAALAELKALEADDPTVCRR